MESQSHKLALSVFKQNRNIKKLFANECPASRKQKAQTISKISAVRSTKKQQCAVIISSGDTKPKHGNTCPWGRSQPWSPLDYRGPYIF